MTLVSDMILELRDHGFDDLTDSRLLSFLNDTYFEFCALEVWPFLETSNASVLTVAGTAALTNLPTDWRAITTMINTTTGTTLEPERRQTIIKRFSNYLTLQEEPTFYYRLGNTIGLYGIPNAVYTLQLDYIKRPAALTSVITGGTDSTPIFPADHHRVLVLGALARANAMEDDPDTSSFYEQQYERKVQTIRNDLWGWQYDRPDRIIDIFSNAADDY